MSIELLAPAGTYEKLIQAVAYGADAVYFGAEFGSLRAYAGNFTLDLAHKGLQFLHQHGKKGYITLNIYPFSDEYKKLIALAGQLSDMNPDGFIVADLGVVSELKKAGIKVPIHISTQANTTSWQTVNAYKQLGAVRVNLARELSLARIKEICRNASVDIEIFIHGAVCFSYSGRCAISDYLTNRCANHGACTHPCRWQYSVVEEQRPNEFLPVFEDDRGQYIFNSKDLALFEYIRPLIAAGVKSFKIEGRMKSIHYLSSVIWLYRQLLDGKEIPARRCLELLNRVKNRGYSSGFIKGDITADDYSWQQGLSKAQAIFVGDITADTLPDKSVCYVRNKIFGGDKLEILIPNGEISEITLPKTLTDTDGRICEFANNPAKILIDKKLPPHSVLRRIL